VKNRDNGGQDVMAWVKINIIESTTNSLTLSSRYPLITLVPLEIQRLIASEEGEVAARHLQQYSVPWLEFIYSLPFCF